MRAALFALFWMFCAAPLAAQSWTADLSDDGGYAGGFVNYPGVGMGFNCAARSIQNKPIMDTMWFEVSVAPSYQFQITFDEHLIPPDPWERSDIVLFVDQTGYRLPTVGWNEMDGGWQVDLTMTDAAIRAAENATRIVLQVGTQAAWEIPVAGLGAALEQARQFCAATWVVTGYPPPPGFGLITAAAPAAPVMPTASQQGVFQLPAQIQAHADKQCQGLATINPDALQAGDLDNDGQPDVVLDWGQIQCNGVSMRGFCGASNCEFNIFMSSRGYTNPKAMLAISIEITPHGSGRLGIKSYSAACARQGVECETIALWNGSDFDQIP